MYRKIFLFLIGFGLSVIGFVYIISYLNLLTIGYNFLYYVNFIIRRIECLYAPIGLILIFNDVSVAEDMEYSKRIFPLVPLTENDVSLVQLFLEEINGELEVRIGLTSVPINLIGLFTFEVK